MGLEQPAHHEQFEEYQAEIIPIRPEVPVQEKVLNAIKKTGNFVGQIALTAFFWRESD